MKTMTVLWTTIVIAALFVTGCNDSKDKTAQTDCKTCPIPASGDKSGAVCPMPANGSISGTGCPIPATPAKGMPLITETIEGTVIQSMPAGRYVYVELETKSGPVWVASVAETVTKGDKVVCRPETEMVNFESPILKRKFDKVYFVGSLKAPATGTAPMMPGAPQMMPPGHGAKAPATADAVKVDVAPAEGGVTIAGIETGRDKLAGTEILLRAKVTKYNGGIMGANWLHVKDASTDHDLVVTTKAEVRVGDTVLIKGKLERDIDLGSGYAYDLIIREASVTAEK